MGFQIVMMFLNWAFAISALLCFGAGFVAAYWVLVACQGLGIVAQCVDLGMMLKGSR